MYDHGTFALLTRYRNELTSGTRNDDVHLNRAYVYDPIGNRSHAQSGLANDPNDPNTTYLRNALNQYYRAATTASAATVEQGLRYDADGNLVQLYVAADMNCDGVIDFDDVSAFMLALEDPNAYIAAYPNCNLLNADTNGDGAVTFDDIDPLVLALSDPASYAAQFPSCHVLNADCNRDGVVNFDDINPFVAILSGGG